MILKIGDLDLDFQGQIGLETFYTVFAVKLVLKLFILYIVFAVKLALKLFILYLHSQ